jgi:hypothetical protein
MKQRRICVRVFNQIIFPTSKLTVQKISYYDYVCFLGSIFNGFLKWEENVLAVSPLLFGNVADEFRHQAEKKKGPTEKPRPIKCEGQKPPEGNSCCGGTGRKPPSASAVCTIVFHRWL